MKQVDHYNEELRKIFDEHSSEKEWFVSSRNFTTWLSDDIKQRKPVCQKGRRLEIKRRSARLQVDHDAFKSQSNKATATLL